MAYYDPIVRTMASMPEGVNAAILIRHSERFPILHPDMVFQVGLTPAGVKIAKKFGMMLGKKFLPGRMMTSPIGRCVKTLEAISAGAGWNAPMFTDDRLGHPFIQSVWDEAVPGLNESVLPEEILQLTDFLLDQAPGENRLDIMVTHDTVVGAMVHYYFREEVVYPEYWPNYLEGVVIWREPGKIQIGWRQTILDIRGRLDGRITASAD